MAICGLLASCWLPEQFSATLSIDKNLNYVFRYEGKLAYGPALGEISERGSLSRDSEVELRGEEAELRRHPGFEKVTSLGNGRFEVVYATRGVINEQAELFLGLVKVDRTPQGAFVVRGATISTDARRDLATINCKFEGRLKVTVELPVMQHNASTAPAAGGVGGSYEWQINLDQKTSPIIILDGKNPAARQIFQQPTSTPQPNQAEDRSSMLPGERYGQTRTRFVTMGEAQALSDSQLQYAINEIYARHGLRFKDPGVQRQFGQFSWYRPDPNLTIEAIELQFTEIETENTRVLGEVRNARQR